MTVAAQTAPIFSAKLTPNRAMSLKGLRLAVAVAAILSFGPGLVFFAMGAWPVVGFMGLDVLALYWALRASMRDTRRYEQITVSRGSIDIRRVFPSGFSADEHYNPFNVRLVVERDFDERTTGLKLRSKERDTEIGAFLNPEDKASFAKAFGRALREARGRG